MRQLHLFKGQKSDQPKPPIEFKLHCALADALRMGRVNEGWFWSHIPAGEYRTPATAGRLLRMGVRRGLPDFIFIGPGKFAFLELKRPGGKMSVEQFDVMKHIIRAGGDFLCTDDVEDAIGWLADMGIVRVRVSA